MILPGYPATASIVKLPFVVVPSRPAGKLAPKVIVFAVTPMMGRLSITCPGMNPSAAKDPTPPRVMVSLAKSLNVSGGSPTILKFVPFGSFTNGPETVSVDGVIPVTVNVPLFPAFAAPVTVTSWFIRKPLLSQLPVVLTIVLLPAKNCISVLENGRSMDALGEGAAWETNVQFAPWSVDWNMPIFHSPLPTIDAYTEFVIDVGSGCTVKRNLIAPAAASPGSSTKPSPLLSSPSAARVSPLLT